MTRGIGFIISVFQIGLYKIPLVHYVKKRLHWQIYKDRKRQNTKEKIKIEILLIYIQILYNFCIQYLYITLYIHGIIYILLYIQFIYTLIYNIHRNYYNR